MASPEEKLVTVEKLVAVRLPIALYQSAQRYADLYRTNLSALLREGLEMRLQEGPSQAEGPITPLVVTMVRQLATQLATAAEELAKASEGAEALSSEDAGATAGSPPQEPIAPHAAQQEATPSSGIPPFDITKYYLGRLCVRGHAWPGTQQTLLLRKGNNCPDCNTERNRAYRQRHPKKR